MRRVALVAILVPVFALALPGVAGATPPEPGTFDNGFNSFVDTEVCAAAQAEAAASGDLADRIASSLQEQAAAGSPEEYQKLVADNQELGNTFDQQEQTLVSSLSA